MLTFCLISIRLSIARKASCYIEIDLKIGEPEKGKKKDMATGTWNHDNETLVVQRLRGEILNYKMVAMDDF